MAKRTVSDPKKDALRQHGCLNPKPETIKDELFVANDFFDPRDLLQVKYEVIRRIQTDRRPIQQVAQLFGFSRPTVYQALLAFEQGGLAALLPRRPGPRHAHKLNEEIIAFLESNLQDNPSLRTVDLVKLLWDRYELSVYPSSIDRALRRYQKKTR